MTDNERTMLEFVAKACEYSVMWCKNGVEGDEEEGFLLTVHRWNPLENIDDCAEIETLLMIDVQWFPGLGIVQAKRGEYVWPVAYINDIEGRREARMRAVVNLAARLGREM